MTATTTPRTTRGDRSAVGRWGLVLLALGALGVAVWGAMAAFAVSYGSVAADTLAGQMVVVGVEDPVNEPEVWVGRTGDHGTVVFEGTREELDAVNAEGRSAYQAALRRDWLVPPLVISAVGLVLVGLGRRGRDDRRQSQPASDA